MSKKPKTTSKVADYAALATLGIARVEVRYDGCDDNGCIEAVIAYGATGEVITELPDAPVTIRVRDTVWNDATQTYEQRFNEKLVPVRDAIEHWCYELLEDHYPGWEIDGGSNGTITIDVKKRRGRLDHEACYTEYTSDSVRFS